MTRIMVAKTKMSGGAPYPSAEMLGQLFKTKIYHFQVEIVWQKKNKNKKKTNDKTTITTIYDYEKHQ